MRILICIAFISLLIWSCSGTTKSVVSKTNDSSISNDTIRIANDEIEYEIIIIDPGFTSWLNSVAMQRGYYNQSFLESRNRIWVTEYNKRVNQPQLFNPNLYMLTIDYRSGIDYGYEVNYLLYNYLVYFQTVNKQNLGTFVARP